MKKNFLLFFLLAVAVSSEAQVNFIQNIKIRNIQNLDGKWHYIVDPLETGYLNGNRKPFDEDGGGVGFYINRQQRNPSELIEYDFEQSPTLDVPGDWNSQKPELLFYEGTIWYQHDFNVTLKEGERYFLNFGAVNYETKVYVNGTKVGMHVGGFTPFQFEVTKLLHNGKNFVVLHVNNMRRKDAVPCDNFDWWNYGGITRDVVLAEMPGTFISDYKIQLTKDDPKKIAGYIQLDGVQSMQNITVNIPETNLQAKIVTDASGKALFSLPVKQLTYWSPESPKLYDVIISTEKDTVNEKIGFRTIATKGKDILLNGKPVFLRGICLHEEDPLIPGRPRSKGDLRMLLEWAKELNCNFVRLTHYPHNEYMSQLADEMGLMLWEEIPVYWSIAFENDSTFANASHQLSELITRDKNRASVLIWSIGNETPINETREKFMEALADSARELDNTRLVSAALSVYGRENNTIHVYDRLCNKLDVVSINEYLGWYGKELPNEISKYHFKIDFDKPVLITELGAEALGGFHADSTIRYSEEFQESFYINQVKLLKQIDGLCGITPWLLVDYRSPKRLNPVYQDYWNRKGLYTETGKKKKAFFVLKTFYDEMKKQYAE